MQATPNLVGRFTPHLGAPEICLTAGVLQSDTEAGGIDIDLVLPDATIRTHFGHDDFEPFACPESSWSGFHRLCLGLPEGEPSAFWLVTTPTGHMPPVFASDVFLDDLFFVAA